MSQTFKEKWLESVDRSGSVLCGGLDPAEFRMGRGNKGLPKNERHKIEWAHDYVEAIAPYCAAIKPNSKYWGGEEDRKGLKSLIEQAHDLGLVIIDDCKLADLNDTNEAGIYFDKKLGFDALTIAPYGGNMKGTADLCKKHEIGGITMCLMSNPEYKREKNSLIEVDPFSYDPNDVLYIDDVPHVRRYIQLAHDAVYGGLDGIVVGAPSKNNHITDEELKNVEKYSDGLVLCPGVGAQGGGAGALWNYFGKNNVIVNASRSMMFPEGSDSSMQEQAEAAKYHRDLFNKERAA